MKQKEQRTGFRQSRCDRSTIVGSAPLPTVRTVTQTPPRQLQAKTTHPSPSACEFRLLLNGLAAPALGRIRACDLASSDEGAYEGAYVRQRGAPCEGDGVPVHVGVGVSVSRGGPTSRAHAAAAILISESGDTVKRRKRCNALRDRRLNDLRGAARPTRSTGTDPSVTIRPRIPTPVQLVSPI